MHSSLMWFACHHGDYIGDLAKIVKCTVSVHNLPEFFWIHLQKDIEQLSTAIGRSQDEAAILIHHVLKKILLENPPTGKPGRFIFAISIIIFYDVVQTRISL